MNKQFTCIICPRGCSLTVDENHNVYGNSCPRGEKYALSEITNPVRTLTSSVVVKNRKDTFVSVKTDKPIPKEKVMELASFLNTLSVKAPCKIGDVIIENPLKLDCNIIITKNID